MFTEKIPFNKAVEEVNALLDKRVIYPRRRKALQPAIDSVAEAIQYGFLTIEEDGTIKQQLADPVKDTTGKVVMEELTYKARLDMGEVNAKLNDVSAVNADGKLMVFITALTGEVAGMINKMNSGDKNIAESIALFFS